MTGRKKKAVWITGVLLLAVLGILGLFWLTAVRGGRVSGLPEEEGEEDGWTYRYAAGEETCSVIRWQWDGDEDHRTICVPEEIDGRTVTSLSNADWNLAPFEVTLPEELSTEGEEIFLTEEEPETAKDGDSVIYHFDLVLGDAVKTSYVKDVWVCRLTEDGGEEILYKMEYEVLKQD